MGEEKCAEVVVDAWKEALEGGAGSIRDILKVVAGGLTDWSRNVLGDLEKRVKQAKKELEMCRRQ